MRVLFLCFAALSALSVLSCPPLSPARDTDADMEQFAKAAVRRPVKGAKAKGGKGTKAKVAMKPCRDTPCGAVPRAKLMASRDSTYIDLLVSDDSLIRRWPVRVAAPVRVWIAPPPADAALVEHDVLPLAQVRRAFGAWESVGVPVRFEFVEDSARAEVHVRWTDQLPHQRAGLARRKTNSRNWLVGGGVVLALRDSSGAPYAADTFLGVAVHEVGHVLGLEHSDAPDDVMAPLVRGHAPSARDRATARVLYGYSAGRVR